jgi:LCP family protein required for cell wall assembly
MHKIFKILSFILFFVLSITIIFLLYINYSINNIEKFSNENIKTDKNNLSIIKNNNIETEKYDKEITNILLFSIGSKGIDKNNIDKLNIGEKRALMADGLTDSILLVNYNRIINKINILSIPRDLYIDKYNNRINTVYNNYGVTTLVTEIEELTNMKIDHNIAINFDFFVELYDTLGGLKIYTEYPVRDNKAKLSIDTPGCQTLKGSQLLAFARSRNWQVYKDNRWQSDYTSSDWGRIDRQQYLLRESVAQFGNFKLLFKTKDIVNLITNKLIIDQNLNTIKLLNLFKDIVSQKPKISAYTFPGSGANVNDMSVIIPDYIKAEKMLLKINSNSSTLENNEITDNQSIAKLPWLDNSGDGGRRFYISCK